MIRNAPVTPVEAAAIALTVIGLAGCSDTSSGRVDLAVTRDTVGDTIIVRTEAGSVWGETRRLVPDVTFGVLDGPDHYMFGSIAAIAVSPDQRIYLLDRQVPAVRMYGPDGSFIRDIGRIGEGPGEYEEPDAGLAYLPDGRLILRDPGTGKMLVWDAEGEHLADWRLPYGGGFNTSNGFFQDREGHLLSFAVTNLGEPVTEWKYGLIRFTADGEVRDTLPYPEWNFEPWQISGQHEGSSSTTNVPFSPQRQVAYSPLGYFVGGVSTDYRIEAFGPGPRVLRIERTWDPVPVDPAEARIRRLEIEKSFRDRFPGWSWNGPDIPDTKPPFDDIFVGEDARIWVRVPTPSERFMDAAEVAEEERATDRTVNPFRSRIEFDVFSPDGDYLGRVVTPEGFSLSPRPVFRGDHVWAVTRDEFEVQRVNRFVLEAPVEGEDTD